MNHSILDGSLWQCDVWSVTVFTEVGHRDKRQEILENDVVLVLDISGPSNGRPIKVLLATGIGYVVGNPESWGTRLA